MRGRPTLVIAFVLAACGSDGGTSPTGPLAPPPEGQGIQLAIDYTLQPGEEVNVCRYVPIPADLSVGRFEHRMTDVSHHFLIYPTGIANDMIPEGVLEACDEDEGAQEVRLGFGFGTQSPSGDLVMPEGVGYKIVGGLAWQIEFHAVNYTDEPVHASAAANFWKARDPVTSEAGTLFMYHDVIAIPAGATASVRQRCPIAEDIQLLGLVGHTHSRGVGFTASLDGPPLGAPQMLADLSSGDADTVEFDPAVPITSGQVVDYQCDFLNNTDALIVEGFSARRNEMCVLAAYYFKPGGERMSTGEEVCWGRGVVYTGDRNCMQTQACDQAIDWSTWDQETGPAELYELCRVEACDDSYGALDVCRWEMCPECFVKDAEDRPIALLYDDPACTTCAGAMCADEMSACQAHTCP